MSRVVVQILLYLCSEMSVTIECCKEEAGTGDEAAEGCLVSVCLKGPGHPAACKVVIGG